MADEIGGYFARLRLIVAQEDFNTGVRSLTMLEMEMKQTSDRTKVATNNWKDFVVGLAAAVYLIKQAAGALKEMYAAYIPVAALTVNTGFEWGQSSVDVQHVQNFAKARGIDDKQLVDALTKQHRIMDLVSQGKLDESQVMNYHFLGLDWRQEKDKSPTDLLKDLLKGYMNHPTPATAQNLQDVLGAGAVTAAQNMLTSGLTFDQAWQRAIAGTFTDNGSNKDAQGGFNAVDEFKMITDSIKTLGMSDFMAQITPLIKQLNQFLIDNKDLIKATLKDLTAILGDILKIIGTILGLVFKLVLAMEKGKIQGAAATEEHNIEQKIKIASGARTDDSIANDILFPTTPESVNRAGNSGAINSVDLRNYMLDKLITTGVVFDTDKSSEADKVRQLYESKKDAIFNFYIDHKGGEKDFIDKLEENINEARDRLVTSAGG